ncbi:MAG: alanine racemase, partial [Hyphomicrobiaceae bacterium]
MASAPADARAVLEIDLDALSANWKKLTELAGPAECAGIVKADAYGLGLEEVSTALTDAGCRTFFVATLGEGRRVRAVQPGAQVFILDGLLPGACEHYAGFDLTPVLSSVPEVVEWAEFCRRSNRRYPAALHVDTGMHRLGILADEYRGLNSTAGPLDDFDVTLVMSHLACADEPGTGMNREQRQLFDELRQLLPNSRASLANSGGVFLGQDFHYDLVRPGIALYGGRAFRGAPHPMSAMVTFSARTLQMHQTDIGETIGYGANFSVTHP